MGDLDLRFHLASQLSFASHRPLGVTRISLCSIFSLGAREAAYPGTWGSLLNDYSSGDISEYILFENNQEEKWKLLYHKMI